MGKVNNTPSTWRSIRAVAAGFLSAALLSIGTDRVLHGTGVYPPVGQPMAAGLFGLATTYRLIFQVLGGWITARLAPQKPMKHVWILAGIGQVLSLLGLFAWRSIGEAGGPLWYPVVLILTAIPSVWLGGRLFMRHARTAN